MQYTPRRKLTREFKHEAVLKAVFQRTLAGRGVFA